MLLLISPGFVLAPLLAVSDFMVRCSQRSDKLHDGQSCYWRRKSEMPLPAVSAMRMERKIIYFTIILPDVSSRVAVSVEESCGTAVTQGSSQAQLCCKCFWVCTVQYIFFSKNVLSLGVWSFATTDSPKLKKMLSFVSNWADVIDWFINYPLFPRFDSTYCSQRDNQSQISQAKFDVLSDRAVFLLPVSDEWLLLWN